MSKQVPHKKQGENNDVVEDAVSSLPNSDLYTHFKKQNVQDYLDNLHDNEFLDNFCMLCKRTIDDEDGFMKCCPNEEYIKGWMDLTETYLPCCFHKVCRLCFLENFSRIQNFPRYVISESMRCFIPGCKNNYFLGDLNRWSHNIENSILHLIYGNQLVMKKQIFGLKIFKCKKCKCCAILSEELEFYCCKKCSNYVCVKCQRSATDAHYFLTCEQMAKAEAIQNHCFIYNNLIRLVPEKRKLFESQ